METEGEKPSENFPKIDNIWSEADENLVIKEEIVSDLEPEPPISPQEDSSRKSSEIQTFTEDENSKCIKDFNTSAIPHKKKVKTKNLKNEDIEIFMYRKSCCAHDPKNFKMVKRRLRCGDCRSLVCPECCKVMTPNLSSHFLGTGVNKSEVFVCRFCSIIFHSLCALQAHIRIHSMEIPYVCPDCGLIYNNMYFLILHLQNKCFHVYKIVRYKCKNCPPLYFSAESFKQHVQELHLECVFRCLYCSSLFTNHSEFNSHMRKLHQKQKAQYLNYYRCSLCSNMVIPQFMYEKHIAQHCDNPTLYEIHYQCVCGETFNAIGGFRAHALSCNFKKILPFQWRFLQSKFKTQEISHVDYYHNKDVCEPSLPCANTSLESESNLCKTTDTRVEEKTECAKLNGTSKSSNGEDDINAMEAERTIEANVVIATDSNSVTTNIMSDLLEKETSPNENPKTDVDNLKISECVQTNIENMEVVQNSNENGTISKIYDHIPCDHLGYVIKTQCSEENKQTVQGNCDEIVEGMSIGDGKYQIVTELDEKTGHLRAKSIPVDNSGTIEGEEEDGNHLNENDDEKFMDVIHEKAQTDIQKLKSHLIKCPFCTIMFPKHNTAFQQFKLHIDSNHPDAAINITVSNEKNAAEKENSSNQSSEVKETQSCNDTPKEQFSELSSNSNLNFSDKEVDNDKNNIQISDNSKIFTDSELKIKKNLIGKLIEKQNSVNETHCVAKKEKDPLCWTVSISINSSDQRRAEEYKETLKLGTHNNHAVVNKDKASSENSQVEMQGDNAPTDNNPVGRTTPENVEIIESKNSSQNAESAAEEGNYLKISSECDGEGDTSKNSSWSSISSTPLMSSKESITGTKSEEREKSRRESEVWSELYESLMHAEKLKKKKAPTDSDGKRKSLVSDYSSKRVVKKPKRYGESSDSGESNENSDFDEFPINNDFLDKINSDEADTEKTDKDGLTKKQKLLIKLENVDGRLADYLFDLITKKEKMLELYKKHSVPRIGHDLRSYRKKVLNGIKHRGRPFKVLRCQDSLKEKYPPQLDRNIKEGIKKKEECSPDSKLMERKRGRPRKYQEVAKIKERRRSDKEVSFIEKNFEKDENELSPSKRKRKLSTKLQYYKNLSDEKDDFSSGQVIVNKTFDPSKKFICAVCKQTFLEMNEFREHVIMHRTEENTYQCMECGECFVVRPSLEKHLHAFHKIKNTDKYIVDNQCCNIKKEEVEEEPLKENQCKVCKDQFDKASDLTKHFRIHGMAFLKEFKKDGKVK